MSRVYSLTPLTRSVNLQRRIVIQGFDLPLRSVVISSVAVVPGALLAVILWPLLGTNALFAVPVVIGAAFWLVESRTRSGLQLRQYQRFMDMRRDVSGQFLLCGEIISPRGHQFGRVVASSMPGVPLDPASLFPEVPTRHRTRRMVRSNRR